MALGRLVRCATGAGLTAWLLSSIAGAHGAFPQSTSFTQDPSDPNRYWVGTSFGVVTSADAGRTWSWLCEEAVSYEGYDPTLAVTANGSLVLGTFDGLRVSHGNGCSWMDPETSPDQMVAALYAETDSGESVLALFSIYAGGGYKNQIWQSVDNAETWSQVGQDIERAVQLLTVRSAPSDPNTLYVSGKRIFFEEFTSEPVTFRSVDRGENWQEVAAPAGGVPRLVGVHPLNASRVFMRIQGESEEVQESIWQSSNGGDTWTQLHSTNARLFGVEFSPDLKEIWLGYGAADELSSDDGDRGIWVGRLDDPQFERVFDGPVGCLTQSGGTLFVCTRQFYHGFELGRSSSPYAALEPLWELDRLEGVVDCRGDTDVGAICPAKWPEVCSLTSQCSYADAGSADTSDATPVDDAGDAGDAGDADVAGEPSAFACQTAPRSAGASARAALLSFAALFLSLLIRRQLRRSHHGLSRSLL